MAIEKGLKITKKFDKVMMAPEINEILETKIEVDAAIAAIDGLSREEIPTRVVGGKTRPGNMSVHKRKLRRQVTKDHEQDLLTKLIAVLVDAGYLEADGCMQFGVFAIHRNGFPVEEEI